MGMVYALMSMGLVLLVRAVGLLNFAQGDLLALGAFIGCSFLLDVQMPLWAAAISSLVLYLLIGAIFCLLIYWPVRKSSYSAAVVISTLGASIVVRETALMIWGSYPIAMPAIFADANSMNQRSILLEIGGATISVQYIAVFVIALMAILLVFTLFEKLYVGRMLQAASQDRYAAQLIGIPVLITTVATYMISIGLAATAGFLVGPILMVSASLSNLQLYAFAGLVIGGAGDIKGAIVGSLLVGLISSFSALYFATYKDAIVFMVLIFFLIFKPNGLIKSRISVKV